MMNFEGLYFGEFFLGIKVVVKGILIFLCLDMEEEVVFI